MAEFLPVDRAAVLSALDGVRDPRSGQGLASAGLVQALVVGPGRAGFMLEVAAADAERRGPTPVYPGRADGDEFHIEQVPAKGGQTSRFDTGGASSAYTGIGRYVFMPKVFDVIDEVDRALPSGAERDDIPVMQRLLERQSLIGRRIRGRFLDVGVPEGFREAEQLLSS